MTREEFKNWANGWLQQSAVTSPHGLTTKEAEVAFDKMVETFDHLMAIGPAYEIRMTAEQEEVDPMDADGFRLHISHKFEEHEVVFDQWEAKYVSHLEHDLRNYKAYVKDQEQTIKGILQRMEEERERHESICKELVKRAAAQGAKI